MHFNIKQIIQAWVISFNPTKRERELAESRGRICEGCESNKVNRFKQHYCGECGCPIGKKIFTDEFNVCDLGKWEEVDRPFFDKQKVNKTLF